MINVTKDCTFILSTRNYTYSFFRTADGDLKTLYAGKKADNESLKKADRNNSYSEEVRLPVIFDGSCRFSYISHSLSAGIRRMRKYYYPQAVMADTESESLVIEAEIKEGIKAEIIYTVFPSLDAISKRMIISSGKKENVSLLVSSSFNIPASSFSYIDRNNEKKGNISKSQTLAFESQMIRMHDDETSYMILPLYNQSITSIEKKERCMNVSSCIFKSFTLDGELELPETVLIFSEKGSEYDRIRSFMYNAILRGRWKDGIRKLYTNTPEGMKTDEKTLSLLIKKAKDLSFEGLCLSDYWYGSREEDCLSYGDWYINTSRFPSGLMENAERVHKAKLSFSLSLAFLKVSSDSASKAKRIGSLQDIRDEKTYDSLFSMISALIENASLEQIILDIRELDLSSLSEKDRFDYFRALNSFLNDLSRKFISLEIVIRADYFSPVYIQSASAVMTENTDDIISTFPQAVLKSSSLSSALPLFSEDDILSLSGEECMKIKSINEEYLDKRALFQFGSLEILKRERDEKITAVYNNDRTACLVVASSAQEKINLLLPSICGERNYTITSFFSDEKTVKQADEIRRLSITLSKNEENEVYIFRSIEEKENE